MVLLDDLVEKRSEGVVAFVAAGVDTDAGVGPFATREDALLEGEAVLVLLVLAFIPNVASQHLGKERLGSTGEEGELSDLSWVLEVGSHHHTIDIADAGGSLCAHY